MKSKNDFTGRPSEAHEVLTRQPQDVGLYREALVGAPSTTKVFIA
jgi:hypothetical protein